MSAAGFPLYHYRATVLRVIDGDGIEVSIDLGLRLYHTVQIRLAGIDAPELSGPSRPAGIEAAVALGDLVRGKQVYLRTRKDGRSFSRYVADCSVEDANGTLIDVAEALIAAGHAVRVPA